MSGVSRLFLLTPPIKMEQNVPKRRHVKFRRRVITQEKEYNIQNTAKFEIMARLRVVTSILPTILSVRCD